MPTYLDVDSVFYHIDKTKFLSHRKGSNSITIEKRDAKEPNELWTSKAFTDLKDRFRIDTIISEINDAEISIKIGITNYDGSSYKDSVLLDLKSGVIIK